jgi:alpha-mannosidase
MRHAIRGSHLAAWAGLLVGAALGPLQASAQSGGGQECWPGKPTLYTVATAHLDTQWRWTIQETIDEYIRKTLEDNFALLEKYPDYVFSFEGAFRYQLMKEYYPEAYERLKGYVREGRWVPNGSWLDAVDTNIPSAESLIRHALYGQGFFQREFGRMSRDVFLPDCFGFSFALPSIAAHCGLLGFSTQKLTWGSAYGVPFDVGLWEGVDGSEVVAALNPNAYVSEITSDLSADSAWTATITRQAEQSGVCVGYKYYGTGDTGGAPTEGSVQWLEQSLRGVGPLRVYPAGADWLANDLTKPLAGAAGLALGIRPGMSERAHAGPLRRLPRYRGELLMTDHGTGCYTSQSAMKRWNRKNERLADAAERAAVVAHWLGALEYPRETLREAWTRFLWHQFHDDLTGTSIPEAYQFSWNDEALASNQFADILTQAVGAVSQGLDTDVRGIPIVVYNPLSIDREDIVEATIPFGGELPEFVQVFDPEGGEVPSQVNGREPDRLRIAFLARVPSVGFAVYDVRPSATGCRLDTGLRIDTSSLASQRYQVSLDLQGDIVGMRDLAAQRELLAGPAQLQLLDDSPLDWAAWEVDFDDMMAAPRAVVGVPARVRILEQGPARVTLEVVRETGGSIFTQRIRLGAGGAGDRVEIDTEIDWRTPGTLLKAAFPLTVSNAQATYDIGLGTIQRGTNHKELYEVPGQQWADLTDASGEFGVAVCNDCRYGWDKPDDHTLRLTLVRTPAVNERWSWIKDQSSQDLGRHHVLYALASHAGDWRAGDIPWTAERLNQPLRAFQAPKHGGSLGRSFSFLTVTTPVSASAGTPRPRAAVRALKLAEESDEIVCRLQELDGAPQERVTLSLHPRLESAREVNGAEEAVSGATTPAGSKARVVDGDLSVALGAYQPRAFAVLAAPVTKRLDPPEAVPIDLPYNLDGISTDQDRTDGDFDGAGRGLAGELLPQVVRNCGVEFRTGPRAPGWANVVACQGQSIPLPAGPYNRIYLLAAAVGGDRRATFELGGETVELAIQDWATPVAQWHSRLVAGELMGDPGRIEPAYIKEDPVAWVGTHCHGPSGENRAYELTQLYRYRIDLPSRAPTSRESGASTLRLPDDPRIRVLAITAARNENDATVPVAPLGDRARATLVRFGHELRDFIGTTQITLSTPSGPADIRYTLDGTRPTSISPLYKGPITLDATTIVKARALASGYDDTYTAEATFTRREPREPDPVASPQPGLVCRYYEGDWSKLPDFGTLTPPRTDTVPVVAIPSHARQERIGLTFTGFVQVPREGLYTLHLWSDDGSTLLLGGEPLIDNDGLHGRGEGKVNVALKAGFHAIEVRFFQRGGGADLELTIEGPGMPLQAVPAEMLFYAAEQFGPGR